MVLCITKRNYDILNLIICAPHSLKGTMQIQAYGHTQLIKMRAV